MLKRNSLLAILLLFISSTVHADLQSGAFAFGNGDYEKALHIFMPLAQNSNHPFAQYYLGVMYSEGRGVEKDNKKAGDWLLKAAKQGISAAQYRLAGMYSKGKGLPQDDEAAYAWYRVGAHLSHKKSKVALGPAKEKLTDEQFAAAQQLADDYIEKYGEAPNLDKKK